MEAFVFALGAVLPIILMVALGFLLKAIGILPLGIVKPLNKLVFRVFLPTLLFLNIYQITDFGEISFSYIIYMVVAVLVVFAISIPLSGVLTKQRSRRAVLIQSAFRSNCALIGLPLSVLLVGQSGAEACSLLSAASIPLFNILAVISLSLYEPNGKRPTVGGVLLGIVKNPLIIGVALGLCALGIRGVLVGCNIEFRLTDIGPLYSVITDLSKCATPVALLALGAQFEFASVKNMKLEIISGTLMRTFIFPALCLAVAYLFIPDLEPMHYAALVGVFCTPLAVSTVPMTQEMGSDEELAGQVVIWSTVASAFGIFLFSFLLKILGALG